MQDLIHCFFSAKLADCSLLAFSTSSLSCWCLNMNNVFFRESGVYVQTKGGSSYYCSVNRTQLVLLVCMLVFYQHCLQVCTLPVCFCRRVEVEVESTGCVTQ